MPRRALDLAQLRQAVRRGVVEPVYMLSGAEPFFHDEAIRLLQAAILGGGGAAATDRTLLRGAETTLGSVLDAASTYPMGGDRRLVVVREADLMETDDAQELAAYLARPNPRTCLVFSDTDFDRRGRLARALEAGAALVLCEPLDEGRLAAWVRARLAERGYGIDPSLAEAIVAGAGGTGMGRLDAELEKMISAVGAPRPIAPADLGMLADAPRVEDAFRLAAALARGDRAQALKGARDLLRTGEEPLRLLGALAWYLRGALRARVALSRRLAPRATQALYGLHPGQVDRFRREIGAATPLRLRRALGACLAADRELKGRGARDPAHALERLIHRTAPDEGRRP